MGRLVTRAPWALVLLALARPATAAPQLFLQHYMTGVDDMSKPPPQPFEESAVPSQLATLHPNHPLSDMPYIASASEPLKTFWPSKIQFHGEHHVRPYKKSHKVNKVYPPGPPPIPPFLNEEMTQAIFLDAPQFAASNLNTRRPPSNKNGGGRSQRPPQQPSADPVAATTTLEPDTTTYFFNSSLVDLTGENVNLVPVFKDAASTPTDDIVKDYLVPPSESARSEYAFYNSGRSSSKPPPFKVLRVGGGGKSKKSGKARFRGPPPTGPNLLFGESQRNNIVYNNNQPPHQVAKIPPSYKPVPPTQGGFLRYAPFQQVNTSPFPLFPPFNFGGDNSLRGPPQKGNKKKQLPPPQGRQPPPFPGNGGGYFNYNAYRPSTSTVIVPEKQGWIPINNPYTGQPLRSTSSIPPFLAPFFGTTLPPGPRPSPRPVYISPQPTRNVHITSTTNSPSPTSNSTPSGRQQSHSASTNNHSTASSSHPTTPSTHPTSPLPQTTSPSTRGAQQQHPTTPTPHQGETSVEILPSIETPPVTSQLNNPISEFNAEYFLQQCTEPGSVLEGNICKALAQVRLQNNLQNKQDRPGTANPTRRSFTPELPNDDEEEVIYQNPVHGVYRDPYVTIHYPLESEGNFKFRRQQRGRGLLDVSPDADQFLAGFDGGRTASASNPPSYYDFHLNNIPTAVPTQPTTANEFHYLMSAVKPKVVHEKDRSTGNKKGKEAKPERIHYKHPALEPFLVYPEPTTPSPEKLFTLSHVTPKTLRGLRLGVTDEARKHAGVKRAAAVEGEEEMQTTEHNDNFEVVNSQGGLLAEEYVHYHAPVRTDADFF